MLGYALKVGELNLKVMELLDKANTGTFGDPVPTAVRIHPRKGKAILISGHDLADLGALLEQTKGTGINVYTHGEMLPGHGYPKLKAYPHLAGNYGGAWQDQAKEFDEFPGAILMTTNCIQQPRESYQGRIFTSGSTGWPGVVHVDRKDFSPVIAAALAAPGFAADGPDDTIMVGFGHNAVLGVAPVGDRCRESRRDPPLLPGRRLRRRPHRAATTTPSWPRRSRSDCIILTLACGKFRFNKLQFGEIGGLPRLLDIGQCNDAYLGHQDRRGARRRLPVRSQRPAAFADSLWYEQKAVSILLTLLYLGIKNIRIGPTLPAFITPAVLGILQEKFNLMAISTPDKDLAAILN